MSVRRVLSASRVLRTGGLKFDGVDDYATTSDSPYFRGSELTFMAWVNIAAVGGSGWQDLFSIPSSYNIYGWGLCITAPGTQVIFVWNWTGNHSVIYWNEDLRKAGWINIAVTYSESNATVALYRNGVLKSSVTGITPYVKPSSSPLTINHDKTTKGLIGEARIYNRALTQDEILRIYNTGEVIRDGLVLLLDFSEYEGSIAYDKSSLGNHGTIYGAQWVIKKAKRVVSI
jgi:hypothetical protein